MARRHGGPPLIPDPFPTTSGSPRRQAAPDSFPLPPHNTGAAPPTPPGILARVAGVALFIYLSTPSAYWGGDAVRPSLFPTGGANAVAALPFPPFLPSLHEAGLPSHPVDPGLVVIGNSVSHFVRH